MNSSTCMVILLALATPIVAHASDKKLEEQKHQEHRYPCRLTCMFYHRLSALRLGPEVSWIAQDLQQIPQTVRNRWQDCCRRRIKDE